MAKVIALFNQSGGVGKSTLTMNVGYQLIQKGHRVLLIDMDPQGSLSFFMGLEPSDLDQTMYDAIINDQPIPIHADLKGLDLAPTNIRLSGAEIELVNADLRDFRFKEAITPLQEKYDFILVDCPPSLGLLSYITLVGSDYVLIPIQTQYKAFCGTELLLNTITRVKSRPNRQLKIAGFVPTMFSSRNSQDIRALSAIQEQLSSIGKVFDPIPRATAYADAAESHLALALYDPKHSSICVLNDIATYLENL
ncbi:MAG: AAA family ATPase [Phormidesmis sp. CAN_BIN44]|nr:AAA family ATPase [Phormidesmis sp. CAN_BIN44]